MTTLQHHMEQDALVLTPDGCIATSDVPALLAAANRLVDEHPRGTVVLDLSLVRLPGLETIDAVMRLHLTTKRRGRPLQIRHTPAPLEHVLRQAGLSDTLRLHEPCPCRVCTEP
jgi:anti-anti-sigma regulatory factor